MGPCLCVPQIQQDNNNYEHDCYHSLTYDVCVCVFTVCIDPVCVCLSVCMCHSVCVSLLCVLTVCVCVCACVCVSMCVGVA